MLPAGTIEPSTGTRRRCTSTGPRTRSRAGSPPLEESSMTADPAYRDQLGTYGRGRYGVATFEPNRNGGGWLDHRVDLRRCRVCVHVRANRCRSSAARVRSALPGVSVAVSQVTLRVWLAGPARTPRARVR